MSATLTSTSTLTFSGHRFLRHRLVLSLLSGRSIRIDRIRSSSSSPGLRDHEVSFLRLLEKISNGTIVQISYTGTAVIFTPGVITGGSVTHECNIAKCIGWYLAPLVVVAPFAKKPFTLNLKGITTASPNPPTSLAAVENGEEEDETDVSPSVDIIRTVTLPTLQLFGISDGLQLRINKRGSAPLGGGAITFTCPIVRQLSTLNFIEPGRIKRIRGIAHSVRVSPQTSNRMIFSSRGVLNQFINDIYLYSDVYRGEDSGKSPGFALSLVAESTTGALHCAESVSIPQAVPEDIGLQASYSLLEAIEMKGCIDRQHQWLTLICMALGSEDVGRVILGSLTEYSIQLLRDLKEIVGVTFKIKESAAGVTEDHAGTFAVSCFGIGYVNSNRAVV